MSPESELKSRMTGARIIPEDSAVLVAQTLLASGIGSVVQLDLIRELDSQISALLVHMPDYSLSLGPEFSSRVMSRFCEVFLRCTDNHREWSAMFQNVLYCIGARRLVQVLSCLDGFTADIKDEKDIKSFLQRTECVSMFVKPMSHVNFYIPTLLLSQKSLCKKFATFLPVS